MNAKRVTRLKANGVQLTASVLHTNSSAMVDRLTKKGFTKTGADKQETKLQWSPAAGQSGEFVRQVGSAAFRSTPPLPPAPYFRPYLRHPLRSRQPKSPAPLPGPHAWGHGLMATLLLEVASRAAREKEEVANA
jgi:hypothetical protein